MDRNGPDKGPNPTTVVTGGKTVIGDAQDIGAKYGPKTQPHVHMEIIWKGREIDPATILP